MRTEDFSYDLPPDRIAQHPARPRDSSRLLRVDRSQGGLSHHRFNQLPDLLLPGDALVFNRTRVIPARLRAHKLETGGKVEILLLQELADLEWKALVGGKRIRTGARLGIGDSLQAVVVEEFEGPLRRLRFNQDPWEVVEASGEMPLPPYIKEPLQDPEEYQTVYADQKGSAAAPTAGLHFTDRLLAQLERRGVEQVYLTLHVGLDTFAPVTEDDPTQHTIHSEWCELPQSACDRLNRVRQAGGRIVAVGTTSVRTLESAARRTGSSGQLAPVRGPTDLFILPGHEFRATDGMITNFHLPRSTLLMLVSAFAGRETILSAYHEALVSGYRFYSFGDAMLIL